ncbi:MAG: 4Fe-4S binding protein [Clostridiaceae bacterium]|nr:4Fe-4S binding protein [Eubacteriales bacterium]
MLRKIIHINEEDCNGCGLCASACHEGAIQMVAGKAKLMRDDYCDGLGDCLPVCPTGAISFVEREAAAYDEQAVLRARHEAHKAGGAKPQGCPGSKPRAIVREAHPHKETSGEGGDKLPCGCPGSDARALSRPQTAETAPASAARSELMQWPVQIKLVPVNAPYFDGANLLVAADCTAFAYGDFHRKFIKNHIALIGCPKLDAGDYAEKLTAILAGNNIKSVKVVRMEVPCCGGIENAVKRALQASGKFLPWQVVTISTDGRILED